MPNSFTLGAGALLDFAVDWNGWLAPGETITDYNLTTTVGVIIDRDTHANGVVTIWLKGGQLGYTATVSCGITTSSGRHDCRMFTVAVVER